MGTWHAELKGGPFGGEKATIPTLPPRIFVLPCPKCGSHWYDAGDGEPYTLDEVFEDSRCTYVHGDTNGSGGTSTDEREKAPKPGELVPA
jgi:hypothetical protein